MFVLSHLAFTLAGMLMLSTSVEPTPAPAGGDSGDTSIADAGKEFLAGLSAEQLATPLAGPDDEDGDGALPATPAPAEAATDVGEPLVRDHDGAEWNEDAERWTLNGKFVGGSAPDGWTKPVANAVAKPAKVSAPDPAATDADTSATPVKVTLPGIGDRGEEDIEVEVDPELATRIQRLKNDGMRAKEYTTRRADLDARESALEAYSQELELDPVGFHINKMPAAQQLEVARALLVDHLDALWPDIEKLRDPTNRIAAMRETQGKVKQSSDRVTQQRAVATAVKQVLTAVDTVIPDGTDDATAADFRADARRDLAAAADRGERVSPDTVTQLLARRVKLYGFDKPAPSRLAMPAVPAARPVSDRARDIAARRPAPADAAASTEARIRRTQAARSAATRIAPAGAGAAPTQSPALPPEAEVDIASVGRYLRKQGLPDSWRPASE